MFEPYGHLAYLHADDRLRAADEHRLRMLGTRRRPSGVMRVYARLWWASRPRATSWAPALLEARYQRRRPCRAAPRGRHGSALCP